MFCRPAVVNLLPSCYFDRNKMYWNCRFRTVEHEYDGVKCHCDDEIQQREEVQRQVAKAQGECDGWRRKFEQDALVRIEELESTKVNLTSRFFVAGHPF